MSTAKKSNNHNKNNSAQGLPVEQGPPEETTEVETTMETTKATTETQAEEQAAAEADPNFAIVHDRTGGRLAAERFAARAMAIPREKRARFRGVVGLIAVNVRRGAANLIADEARIVEELKSPKLTVLHDLLDLPLAAVYTADLLTRQLDHETELAKKVLPEAQKLHGLMVATLKVAADGGVIPASPVAMLQKERGNRGIAKDLIAAAEIFRTEAKALAGKTVITQEQVARAAELGGDLVLYMPQKGQSKSKGKAKRANAIQLRDGLFTLMLSDYDYARRVGGLIYGEERDQRVPNAFATSFARRAKDPEAAAQADAKRAAGKIETAKKKKAIRAEKAKVKEEAKAASREADRKARELRKALKEASKKKPSGASGSSNNPPGGTPPGGVGAEGAQGNNT